MKFFLLTPGILAFALILSSCFIPDIFPPENKINLTKNFYATGTGGYYQLQAELLVTGEHCNVWAEKGAGVTKNTAEMIANEYDNNIYSKVISVFSAEKLEYKGYTGTTIEFADMLGEYDKKLCILLLDIKDNYSPGGS